jgi:hypothetical protein
MARIYVGNLPLDIRSKDIEDLFWKYGRIRDVDLKNLSRPPAFAFVSFERYEDAEDAIRGRGALLALPFHVFGAGSLTPWARQTVSCSRDSVSGWKCPRAARMSWGRAGPTGLWTAATTGIVPRALPLC